MQRAKVVDRPAIKALGALLAVALTVCLVAALAARADGPDRPRWQACHREVGPDFECATVRVPLDYDRAHGRRISLALVRLTAGDPEDKVGSIFLNPGARADRGWTSSSASDLCCLLPG